MKNNLILFVIALCFLFVGCSKNDEVTTATKIVTGNVSFTNLTESLDSTAYLVLSQNEIRFLDLTNPKTLTVSSTLPLTKVAFDKVFGTKDKLVLQNANSLLFYSLEGTGYIEKAVIKNVIPCDKVALTEKFLVVAQGDENCSDPNRFLNYVKIYDTKEFTKPIAIDSFTVEKTLQLKHTENVFFHLDEKGIVSIYEQDSAGKLTKKSNFSVATAYDFDLAWKNKILVVRTKNKVEQYNINDIRNPVLLSKLPIINQ